MRAHRRSLKRALGAIAAGALCAAACAPAPDPEVEQTLVLRDSGVPIRCDDAALATWTVVRAGREDRYGFRHAAPGACRFALYVPDRAQLLFRVQLERKRGRAEGAGHAAIAVRVGELERTLYEEDLAAPAGALTGSVELPSGEASVTLSVTAARGAAPFRVAWTDLVVRSRDPDFEGALPWSTDPARALAPFFASRGERPASAEKRRLLVVGIDGASWGLMEGLLAAGEMPALASLRKRGRWGVLRSTIVPESAMAWTAIQTGVDSGKHGVYTFFSAPTPRRPFWHHLGDRGLRSVIVALPKASPERPLEGLLVGGWTLSRADAFTWPAELKPHLLRAGYDPALANLRNVEYYAERMRRRTAVARELLAYADWDLAFVVYEYSDTVGHRFGLHTEEWKAVYRAIDSELASLLAAAGERTSVLLVSDHGWKDYPRSLSVDAWLAGQGLSEWKTNLPASGSAVGVSAAETGNGDFPREGRDARRESLERVVRGLGDLVDPETGERAVERVRPSERVFEGPFAAWAPGRLLVEMRDDYRAVRGRRRRSVFDAKARHREHHSHAGIYLLAGPGIEAGPGEERSVFDVAPTVLRFFGIAPPDDAAGRTLHDFGIHEPLHPPGPSYFEETATEPGPPGGAVSSQLEEELRALGYIE